MDTRSEVCPRCGRELRVVERPTIRKVDEVDGQPVYERGTTPMLATCQCVKDEQERQRKQEAAEERQRYINSIIRDAGTSARLTGASFETWRRSLATDEAFQKALQCAEHIAAGKPDSGLILLGPVGNGKSHLAESIGKRVAQAAKTYVFRSVPELMIDIRSTFNGPSGDAEIMDTLYSCDLLILDDLGAEKWTEWIDERLFVIVDGRYRRRRNIVVTSNAPDMKALQELVGPRTYDRLLEMCGWVVNGGQSQRRKAQAERFKAEGGGAR